MLDLTYPDLYEHQPSSVAIVDMFSFHQHYHERSVAVLVAVLVAGVPGLWLRNSNNRLLLSVLCYAHFQSFLSFFSEIFISFFFFIFGLFLHISLTGAQTIYIFYWLNPLNDT